MNRRFTPLAILLMLSVGLYTVLWGSSYGATGRRLKALAEEASFYGREMRVVLSVAAPSLDLSELKKLRAAGAEQAQIEAYIKTLQEAAELRQKDVVRRLEAIGARIHHQYWKIMAVAASVPPERWEALLRMPELLEIEEDVLLDPQLDVVTNSHHHNATGTYYLRDNLDRPIKGQGQVIALIDSGADADMDGKGRPHRLYYANGNFHDSTGGGIQGSRLLSFQNFSYSGSAEDRLGHGTYAASCAAGADYNLRNGLDDRGMAPLAGIRSLNVDEGGSGAYLSSALAALEALSIYSDVTVANFSYAGTPKPQSALARMMDQVVCVDDVLLTVSAGNQATDLSQAHGSLNALVVGAVNKSKNLAAFSGRGPLKGRPYPQMVATGVAVRVAETDREYADQSLSGTSLASPLVAGAAALVRQAAPSATALETKALLLLGSSDAATGNPNGLGHGYLRGRGAVDAALQKNYLTWELEGTGAKETFRTHLESGETFRGVFAWMRQQVDNPAFPQLRVTLTDPSGKVLQSRTSTGTEIVLQRRAHSSGEHLLTLELLRGEPNCSGCRVAIAGLGPRPGGNELVLIAPDQAAANSWIELRIENGEPGAAFEVYAGIRPQTMTRQGLPMDVGPAKLVSGGSLDGTGSATFSAQIPAHFTGQQVFLEALAIGAAAATDSNMEVLTVN